MPHLDPADLVNYVSAFQPDRGNLWSWASDGSPWVHYNFFIGVSPEIKNHCVSTFTSQKGEVHITMYPYISWSDCLVSFRNKLVSQPRTTYSNIFWYYSYRWQQEMFHHIAVGVCQLILFRGGYLISGISPKWGGQWYRLC